MTNKRKLGRFTSETAPQIHFTASETPEAQEAKEALSQRYGSAPLNDADCVVAIGGDGFMLHTLHRILGRDLPIYGVNRGTVGFLMNDYQEDGLIDRLLTASRATITPLRMRAFCEEAEPTAEALAINEVSLLRETRQTAKLRISVDGRVRMPELICDGALVCTPAGSTAYNLSAHGPILPLSSDLLALTPISAFRPRRWRGALLPSNSAVTFEVLEPQKRPVLAVADHIEARDVLRVEVRSAPEFTLTLLFDPDQSLEERILQEQFAP